jgi:hypothetical protein
VDADCDIQFWGSKAEHVSDDPFVESSVPEAPEAGERVVVVDAMLHVLA